MRERFESDLVSAFAAAKAIDDIYEVGILVRTESGGIKYWSSLTPDLFNSTVVRQRR